MLVISAVNVGDGFSVLPTIRKAAQSGPPKMRLAAVRALERIGTAACVPTVRVQTEQSSMAGA